MKKALQLLLAQFLWLLAVVLIGTFFYNLYINSLSQVAGQDSSIWNKENLTVSVFLITQIFTFVSGFLLIAHKIYKPGGVLQLIAFIICQFLVWCFLFPISHHLEKKYVEKHLNVLSYDENPCLSQGFFREAGNEVIYFLNDENTKALKIETTQTGTVEVLDIDDLSDLNIVQSARPYKDILIKNTFSSGNSEYDFFGILLFSAKRDLNRGIKFWITFLSMALALSSIYAVSGTSGWKISNFTLCGILYGFILFINGFYWTSEMAFFRNLPFLREGIFKSMSGWTSAPILFIINCLFSIILIPIGSIKFFIRKKRGR